MGEQRQDRRHLWRGVGPRPRQWRDRRLHQDRQRHRRGHQHPQLQPLQGAERGRVPARCRLRHRPARCWPGGRVGLLVQPDRRRDTDRHPEHRLGVARLGHLRQRRFLRRSGGPGHPDQRLPVFAPQGHVAVVAGQLHRQRHRPSGARPGHERAVRLRGQAAGVRPRRIVGVLRCPRGAGVDWHARARDEPARRAKLQRHREADMGRLADDSGTDHRIPDLSRDGHHRTVHAPEDGGRHHAQLHRRERVRLHGLPLSGGAVQRRRRGHVATDGHVEPRVTSGADQSARRTQH